MTQELSLRTLKKGDVIKVGKDGHDYTVMGNNGAYVVAIRQVRVTNPLEWTCEGHIVTDISEMCIGYILAHVKWGSRYVVTSTHGDSVIAVHSLLLGTSLQYVLDAKKHPKK